MSKMTAFLIGVVGGALAGWYSTKKYYSTKCDMEISSMRELCDRMAKDADQKVAKATEEAQQAQEDRYFFAESLKRLGYTTAAGQEAATKATAVEVEQELHPSEEDDYLSDPDELENPTPPELQRLEAMRKRPPEQISEEIFSEDTYSGFEKKEVLWYPKDEVLLDGDTYELMDDPYSFLGTDWISTIENDGEAYVRNYRWEVDYLIIKKDGYGSGDMSLTE